MSQTPPGTEVNLSAPSTYHDEPPRLCVCINEVNLGPDRKDEALLDEVSIFSIAGADFVSEIVKWVVGVLEGEELSKVWDAPAGRAADWKPDDPNEEAWARQMDTMFLGTSYAGPNIVASFPSGGKYASLAQAYIYKRIQPKHMPLGDAKKFGNRYEGLTEITNDDPAYSIAVACQHLTTYGALCRGLKLETDLSDVGLPASQAAGGMHVFDDAAGGSEPKGTWVGTEARERRGPDNKVKSKTATISSGDAHDADRANQKVPGYGPGTIYTYNPYGDQKFRTAVVTNDMLKRYDKDVVEKQIDPSDPTKKRKIDVVVHRKGDIVIDPHSGHPLIDPKIGVKVQVAAAQDVKDKEKASAQTAKIMNVLTAMAGGLPNQKGEVFDATTIDVQLKCPACGELHPSSTKVCPKSKDAPAPTNFEGRQELIATIPLNAQVDGSHIGMVLRKFTFKSGPKAGKVGVQLLDTSAKTQRALAGKTNAEQKASKDRLNREYVMWSRMSNQGIFAAEGMSSIEHYGGKGKFVGCGSLPPLRDPKATLDFVKQARPVALARLVVTVSEHPNPKAPWNGKNVTDHDVLFISRMVRAWGASPTANYHLSRYLLSLRNTPRHKNLQAYWMVFAPRGELAEVMWEQGARKLSVDAMVAEARERRAIYNLVRSEKEKLPAEILTGLDLAPIAVLTHDEEGLAIEVWRNHCLHGGGQGSPPKGIKDLFINPAMPVVLQPEKKTTPAWLEEAMRAIGVGPDPNRPKVSDIPSVHRNPLASYTHPMLYDATGGSGIELPKYLQAEPPPPPAPPPSTSPGAPASPSAGAVA